MRKLHWESIHHQWDARARNCRGCPRAALATALILLAALSPDRAGSQSIESRAASTSAAHPSQTRRTHGEILGTWALTSFYDEDERGEEIEQWGLEPKGRLTFDAHGRFAFDLRDDLALGLCIAYAGSYEITAERQIRFHPDAWAVSGHDESTRLADLQRKDDLLELTSAARPSLAGSFYSHTIWRRLPDVTDARLTHCGR